MWPFPKRVDIAIGPETDDALIIALAAVLKEQDAELLKKEDNVVGSQDLLWAVYRIGREELTVKSGTYEGIILSGPASLVQRLARLIVTEMR